MADGLKSRKHDLAKLSDKRIGSVPIVMVADLAELGVKHNSGGPELFPFDVDGLGRLQQRR